MLLTQAYQSVHEISDTITAQEERIKTIIADLAQVKQPKLVANSARELARQLMILNRRLSDDAAALRQLLQ